MCYEYSANSTGLQQDQLIQLFLISKSRIPCFCYSFFPAFSYKMNLVFKGKNVFLLNINEMYFPILLVKDMYNYQPASVQCKTTCVTMMDQNNSRKKDSYVIFKLASTDGPNMKNGKLKYIKKPGQVGRLSRIRCPCLLTAD